MKPRLKQSQIARFRRRLEETRDELVGQARRKSGLDLDAQKCPDPADQASANESNDMTSMAVNSAHAHLLQVRSALVAIEDGTYGICVDCGEPIPVKRLRAIPESLLCVACQEKASEMAPGHIQPAVLATA
jgi:DnaK suppressor protein